MSFFFFLYEIFQLGLYFFVKQFSRLTRHEKVTAFVEARSTKSLEIAVDKAKSALAEHEQAVGRRVPRFWVHVASAGELEQAIPVARCLAEKLGAVFLLSYFSPSALPFCKNFPATIGILGFPLDIRARHHALLSSLGIDHVFLVRYDLWPGLLWETEARQIPISLLAATARATTQVDLGQMKRRWREHLFRKFTHIFAVAEEDLRYFETLAPPGRVHLAGDSKWSRAKDRAEQLRREGLAKRLGVVDSLSNLNKALGRKCFVFGSPHQEEHEVAIRCASLRAEVFVIYVPHEVKSEKIDAVRKEIESTGARVMTLSQLSAMASDMPVGTQNATLGQPSPGQHLPVDFRNCGEGTGRGLGAHALLTRRFESPLDSSTVKDVDFLIIDKIGLLAEVYACADVAIVGGGFDGQIHNTLEPTSHPVATVFGSRWQRAPEAQTLIEGGAALEFSSPNEMFHFLYQCARVSKEHPNGISPNQRLAEIRLRALAIFGKIPNTSEVVFNAVSPRNASTQHDLC